MKKKVLQNFAMIVPINVQIDWKQSLSDGWDKIKKQGVRFYAALTKDELSGLPVARQKAIKSWGKVENLFNDIIEVKEYKNLSSESCLLKKTKEEYQKDIDKLLNEVYAILNDEMGAVRDDIASIEHMIALERKYVSEQKSKLAILIGSDRKNALKKQRYYQNNVQRYGKKREKVIGGVHDRLPEFGTKLSFGQVETLLMRVNSDEILGMITVFPIIREIAKTYAEITASSGEDFNHAKKYYSMYVVLLELQLHIQKRYIDELKYTYIPRIDDLLKEQQSLIKTTKKEPDKVSANHRNMYTLNLENQITSLDAIELYKVNMQNDLGNMSKAHDLLFKNYKLVMNTLNIVTMSSQVSNLIKESNKLFDKIMAMQAPELVSFNNIHIQKEFSALTKKIR